MNSTRLTTILAVTSLCSTASAMTLETALDATLKNNPAILEAKANLEQAAGHRLVLRSIMWPSLKAGVPGGVQGGHRDGESSPIFFIFARGAFTQPLFNAAIPPSARLGDVDLLIAEQQFNIAVEEQLHAARLSFCSALYNRGLQSIREEQRKRFDENVASQKQRYEAGLSDRGAFASATVQARQLDAQIETARRAYDDAKVKLSGAMGGNLGPEGKVSEPEGELEFAPTDIDLAAETAAAVARRADIKLARLMVRAASEQQRIIEAGYYPVVAGMLTGDFIPVSGIHREGSTRRTEDFTGSELREGAVYTWHVIDNGKVIGAAMKQRAVREVNEIACRRLESNVGIELSRIRNELAAIDARQKSLSGGLAMAEQASTIVQQNLATGVTSQLEYRLAQTGFLDVKSGLLSAAYQHNVAMAEWERATGRYFQFSEETAPNAH
jgi:outer membrane protein TolC